MIIIKSPICLMVFVTHFVSIEWVKGILCAYRAYITFIAVFLRILIFLLDLMIFDFRFAWIVCVSFILLMFVVTDAANPSVFMMRKSKMENVFNVQTVEPNEQHISLCVFSINTYKSDEGAANKKTKIVRNRLTRELNTCCCFFFLVPLFALSTADIEFHFHCIVIELHIWRKAICIKMKHIVHCIGFYWSNKKHFFAQSISLPLRSTS